MYWQKKNNDVLEYKLDEFDEYLLMFDKSKVKDYLKYVNHDNDL